MQDQAGGDRVGVTQLQWNINLFRSEVASDGEGQRTSEKRGLAEIHTHTSKRLMSSRLGKTLGVI